MGTKYSTQTISGYNSTPPSDDGTVSEANKVKWSTHKTKLTDPIKTLAEAINTSLVTALDPGPVAYTSNQTLGASHYGQIIQVSGSGVTLTLTDAATLAAGWHCEIVNTDSSNTVTIGRATGADTIDGTAANISLIAGERITVFVIAAATGFISKRNVFQTQSALDSSTKAATTAFVQTALAAVIGDQRDLAIANNATNPTYKLDFSATEIIVKNSSNVPVCVQTWSGTLDITASGANGLDTGSEASSTWYYIWAIYDGTNKKFLLSTSSSAPTMPGGYTYKALLGVWRNDGSSNFLTGYQYGKKFFYDAQEIVLNNGSANTETAITISSFVPPTAVSRWFSLQWRHRATDTGGGVNVTAKLRVVSGTDFRQVYCTDGTSVAQPFTNIEIDCPNINQTFYYLLTVTAGGSELASMWINGFTLI